MLIPTTIMGVLAIVLTVISYNKGGGEHIVGLKMAGSTLVQILPLLAFAFIVAGMVQILIPQEMISRWVGAESGFKGILIGALLGTITPGGPFISLPIAAGLLRAGASIGTLVAFMTSWALLAIPSLPLQIGIMGWKFALIRFVCTLVFPPVAGLIANRFFSGVSLT